jgi:hypothetical protein
MTGKYCCLGVLCELAVADNVIGPATLTDFEDYYEYVHDSFDLPSVVSHWSGAHSASDDITIGMIKEKFGGELFGLSPADESGGFHDYACVELAALNDSGVSFDMIANIIEEYWEHL